MVKFLVVFLSVLALACNDDGGDNGTEPSNNEDEQSGFGIVHDCLDSDYEGFNLESSMVAGDMWKEILRDHPARQFPSCEKSEGIALHSQSGRCSDDGIHEEYYFYCNDAEIEDQIAQETVVRSTPCIWWAVAEKNSEGFCEYDVACIAQERLPEFGWPEGESFDYHTEVYWFDVCDPESDF